MRLVRRKRDEAHLVVLEDSLETVGGQALFRKVSRGMRYVNMLFAILNI